MSEIKGHLLGIILTISVFGVVLAAMTGAFKGVAETIGGRADEAAQTEVITE